MYYFRIKWIRVGVGYTDYTNKLIDTYEIELYLKLYKQVFLLEER